MDCDKVKPGQRITVVEKFAENATAGMFGVDANIKNRIPSANGIAVQYVPGHGGDVWYVAHSVNEQEDKYTDIAVYCFDEFLEFNIDNAPESAAMDDKAFLKRFGPKLVG